MRIEKYEKNTSKQERIARHIEQQTALHMHRQLARSPSLQMEGDEDRVWLERLLGQDRLAMAHLLPLSRY